jgi:hypothetical protein
MQDLENFAHLVEALRPWLPNLVIVGGWAHRLHRLHPLATSQEYQPLRTRDVDLAFSLNAPLEGDLSDALRDAGFKEELSGEHTPPVTHYYLGQQDAGFYAEFLTVKEGSGIKRDGKPDLTISRAGITAQKLDISNYSWQNRGKFDWVWRVMCRSHAQLIWVYLTR